MPNAGWPLARVGTRSNRRPEPKMLAQKRATTSRPSYSNGIGGIDMKTSSVKQGDQRVEVGGLVGADELRHDRVLRR